MHAWVPKGETREMKIMSAFVSIFFVPVITLYILNKRRGDLFKGAFDIIIKYAVSVCANLVVTEGLILLFEKLFDDIHWAQYSRHYFLTALIVAIIGAYIYEAIVTYLHVSIEIGKTESKEGQDE